MTTVRLELQGLAALRRDLEALGPEVSRVLLGEALERATAIVADAIRARAPVASMPHRRGKAPGELARSIRAEVVFRSPVQVRALVGPRVPYAHLVEYGHAIVARGPARHGAGRSRRLRQRTRIGHVPARPFVRPAAEAAFAEASQVFSDVLREAVARARIGR